MHVPAPGRMRVLVRQPGNWSTENVRRGSDRAGQYLMLGTRNRDLRSGSLRPSRL